MKRMWMKRQHDQGFTLLEVLVSMALIATALVALLRLQAQNLDFQSEARFMTIAGLLTQERLSWIASDPDLREGHSSGDFDERFPEFHYVQEIEPSASGRNLYRVSLQVYSGEDRPERTFSVDTFIYREPR